MARTNAMFWQQCREAQVKVYYNSQNAWCITNKSIEKSVPLRFLPFIKEYNSCPQIMSIEYDFVNGCNIGYKFYLTFFSYMRLSSLGMVSPTQETGIHGHKKIHIRWNGVDSNTHFQMPCDAEC
jgi:hypothetical protein